MSYDDDGGVLDEEQGFKLSDDDGDDAELEDMEGPMPGFQFDDEDADVDPDRDH